jgi:hypothetical protein
MFSSPLTQLIASQLKLFVTSLIDEGSVEIKALHTYAFHAHTFSHFLHASLTCLSYL